MNQRTLAGLTMIAVFGVGCYHATVETGLTPGTQVIEKPMAPSWIYGLVPPETVSTAGQCQSGVAVVETQMSFVNGLIGSITFGIFTPMTIKVTCAAGGGDAAGPRTRVTVPDGAPPELVQAAIDSASVLSAHSGAPVLVELHR